MHIRPCTAADTATLALIGAATVLEAFAGLLPGPALLAHCQQNHTAAVYEQYLADPVTRAWLAEVDPLHGTGAAPVGYALLTQPDFPEGLAQPGELELKRIYVFSRFHGTGAGARMMALAIAAAREQHAPRLLLGLHRENLRAFAFYRRHGFVEIGRREFRLGPECSTTRFLGLSFRSEGDHGWTRIRG